MAINCARFETKGNIDWGIVESDKIFPLNVGDFTTKQIIEKIWNKPKSSYTNIDSIQLKSVKVIEPITRPCQVLCQGANYRQHMIDSGMDPDQKNFNIFFSKTSASLFPPTGKVAVPDFIKLLDYEIELGLVFGKEISQPTEITNSNMSKYVAGFFMANDLSARDIQLPQMQWLKGKSYRGFCPVGPYLTILEEGDIDSLEDLILTLSVNGKIRQYDTCSNLVYKPAEAITELSQFCNIQVGDVLITGTPAGCALKVPGIWIQRFGSFLPEKKKWEIFIKKQSQRAEYLKEGDIVTSSIRTADRRIDLGDQELSFKWNKL